MVQLSAVPDPVAAPPGAVGGRERNRLARHRSYLRAALGLVFAEGLDALTMQRLAAEVGAAVGSVYTDFPSKGALVAEVQREAIERLATSATLLGADLDRSLAADTGALDGSHPADRRTIALAAALTGCVQLRVVQRWDDDLLDPTRTGRHVLVLGLPLGIVLWSLMEYVLHRFAFHEARGKNYGSREHLRHHGSEDTVLESWYLSWAGVLLVSLTLIPFLGRLAGQPDLGWGVGIGYLVAYGFYDLVHWRAHRRPYANRYEHTVRKHHFIHHFHAPLKNHGVTTPFWDRVFGTYEEPSPPP